MMFETELINNNGLDTLPEIFSPEQIHLLEQAFRDCNYYDFWTNKRNLLLFLINYNLALRPKESVSIELSDIDLKAKVIWINPQSNKLRKGRQVPIPDGIYQDLIQFINLPKPLYLRGSNYLFPCRQGEHLSRDQWTDIFKMMLRHTGLWKIPKRGMHGHFTPYTLRHTKATEVYLATGDIMLVANMLGHTTLECTRVYIHLAMVRVGYLDKMRKAMSIVNRRYLLDNSLNLSTASVSA